MNIIKSKKTTKTSITFKIEINREVLLEVLAPYLDCGDVPDYASVYVIDTDAEELDIEDANPVVITWTEETIDDQE